MIGFGTVALVWPFFMIALVLGIVLLGHRVLDRHERRSHPAE